MAFRSFYALVLSKFLPRRICNQAVGPARDGSSLISVFLNQLDDSTRSGFINAIKVGQALGDVWEGHSAFAFARAQDIQCNTQLRLQSNMAAVAMMSTKAGVDLANKKAKCLAYEVNTSERWTRRYKGILRKRMQPPLNRTFHTYPLVGSQHLLPDRVDWTERGAVTAVKNQGNTNTCWAHVAVECIEFLRFRRTGILEPLSVQQVIDCNKCRLRCANKGIAEVAFEYIMKHGLVTASRYPFRGVDGKCRHYRRDTVASISGYYYPGIGEAALQLALCVQPIPVSVYSTKTLVNYTGGIITANEWDLEGKAKGGTDHYVLLVAYDTDEAGTKFWRVKNSWDKDWGEGGYARLERGTNDPRGTCGILCEEEPIPIPDFRFDCA